MNAAIVASAAAAGGGSCGAASRSNEACIGRAAPAQGSLGRERAVFGNRRKTAIRRKPTIRHERRERALFPTHLIRDSDEVTRQNFHNRISLLD